MLPPFTYRFYRVARPSAALMLNASTGRGKCLRKPVFTRRHTVSGGALNCRRQERSAKPVPPYPVLLPAITASQHCSGTQYPRSSADEHRFNGGSCYSGPHTTVAEGDRAPACTLADDVHLATQALRQDGIALARLSSEPRRWRRQLARTHWLLLAASVETMVRSSTSARCI